MTMKKKLIEGANRFLAGNLDVILFFDVLEDVNKNGIWDELNKNEYKALSDFYYIYDLFSENIYSHQLPPKFWKRFFSKIIGNIYIDVHKFKDAVMTMRNSIV